MMFFETRREARDFATKFNRKVVDNGSTATKRWAVKLQKVA